MRMFYHKFKKLFDKKVIQGAKCNIFTPEFYKAIKKGRNIENEEKQIKQNMNDLETLSTMMDILINYDVDSHNPKEPIEAIRRLLNDRV